MRDNEILISNKTTRLSCMGVGWRWRILSSETSELISFGGGVGVEKIFKGDNNGWGWRKL